MKSLVVLAIDLGPCGQRVKDLKLGSKDRDITAREIATGS
jgi:hypothetical protein